MCHNARVIPPQSLLSQVFLNNSDTRTHAHTRAHSGLDVLFVTENEKERRKVITEEGYLPISWQLPYHHTSPPARPAGLSAPVARGLPF